MRIPVFEEIKIFDFDSSSIEEELKKSKAGTLPTYISLSHLGFEETKIAMDNIKSTLQDIEINPYFPYPVYVVTEKISSFPDLPIVHAVSDLPKHFFQKVSRLKPKELAILNKTTLLGQKVSNMNVSQKIKSLKPLFVPQRELYNACRELSFLEDVQKKLRFFESKNKGRN